MKKLVQLSLSVLEIALWLHENDFFFLVYFARNFGIANGDIYSLFLMNSVRSSIVSGVEWWWCTVEWWRLYMAGVR